MRQFDPGTTIEKLKQHNNSQDITYFHPESDAVGFITDDLTKPLTAIWKVAWEYADKANWNAKMTVRAQDAVPGTSPQIDRYT